MDLVSGVAARREFERLVADSTPALRRAAYLMCWDSGEAEDLVQETWLRVARRWPRVRRMDNPPAYARRVLVNAVIDAGSRRTRRRQELNAARAGEGLGHHDQRAARALAAVDNQHELRQALGTLTARKRAILVLRYWEDLPEREVADLLGCSVGSVKSTASRALAELRTRMNQPDQHRGDQPCPQRSLEMGRP
jgi:RNA polymerase sigma-70 factor (sigma-E family)